MDSRDQENNQSRCLGAAWRQLLIGSKTAPQPAHSNGDGNNAELSTSLSCLHLWVVLSPKILMRHIYFCYTYHDIRMKLSDDN